MRSAKLIREIEGARRAEGPNEEGEAEVEVGKEGGAVFAMQVRERLKNNVQYEGIAGQTPGRNEKWRGWRRAEEDTAKE